MRNVWACRLLKHKWELVRIAGEEAYECRRCGKRDFDRPHQMGLGGVGGVGGVGPGVSGGGAVGGGDFGGGDGGGGG